MAQIVDVEKVEEVLRSPGSCRLSRNLWYQPPMVLNGLPSPAAMCALTALAIYAGVSAATIMVLIGLGHNLDSALRPALVRTYNMPWELAQHIPGVFDTARSEAAGADDVIMLCRMWNLSQIEGNGTFSRWLVARTASIHSEQIQKQMALHSASPMPSKFLPAVPELPAITGGTPVEVQSEVAEALVPA